MARISEEDARRYEGGKRTGWFSLKDDGDKAIVQFLWDAPEDIETHTCHTVQVNGKNRQCNCPRKYDDPLDMCPLCASGDRPQVKRYIVLYDHADGELKIWDGKRKFIDKLKSNMNRYSPLSSRVVELERRGKRNDPATDYDMYVVDNVDLVDISELDYPKLVGGVILDKTADEMEEYLRTGEFPMHDTAPSPQLPSRRAAPAAPSRRSSRRAIDPSATGANKEVF